MHTRSHWSARPTALRRLAGALRRTAAISVLLVLAACVGGPEIASPRPGTIAIGLLGDTPYSNAEAEALDGIIETMNAAPLAVVVHVGDVGSSARACEDAWLLARKRQFERIRHPFLLLPGDNEWSDCRQGKRDPLARLARWRELFCAELALPGFRRQPSLQPRHAAYCEHVRWRMGGALFVALNVPGSNNGIGTHPALRAEHDRRMAAVRDWLDAARAEAARPEIRRLVILMHANPGYPGSRLWPPARYDGFRSLRRGLAGTVARLGKPVLLVHGDTHSFRDDRPLPGLRRVEVWGSPQVRWIAALLHADGSLEVRD